MDLNLAIITKVIKLEKTSIDITPGSIRIKRKQRISLKIILKISGTVHLQEVVVELKRTQILMRIFIAHERTLNTRNTKEEVASLTINKAGADLHTVETNIRNRKINNKPINKQIKEILKRMNFIESTTKITTIKAHEVVVLELNSNRLKKKNTQITIRIATSIVLKRLGSALSLLQRPIKNMTHRAILCFIT